MTAPEDRDRDDRPRLSWSEIDKLRDGSSRRDRSERRPRGAAAEARSREASQAYLKEADRLFHTGQGGARGEALARAVRDAHGSDGLTEACHAYRDALGLPGDPALLSLFLDAGDPALVAESIRALARGHESGAMEITRGVRSQLRMLEQSADDDVAYEAEELLARL
jgi:hypothetical protein